MGRKSISELLENQYFVIKKYSSLKNLVTTVGV